MATSRYTIEISALFGAFSNWAWREEGKTRVSVPDPSQNRNPTSSDQFVISLPEQTGDGTINVLSQWPEVQILNPFAEDNEEYLRIIEHTLRELPVVDIVGVSAGFDSYVRDLGKKLTTFDFYMIGTLVRRCTKRLGHSRRFAVLEGGYYHTDLGKNVLAFCQGFA